MKLKITARNKTMYEAIKSRISGISKATKNRLSCRNDGTLSQNIYTLTGILKMNRVVQRMVNI